MIAWAKKHWKWGLPLLLIPVALLLRGFGSLGGLLSRLPPGHSSPPVIQYDPEKAEETRERIIDAREAADKRIVTEADRERRDIDEWIDKGLNK